MARLSAASRRTCFSPSHWHIQRGFSFTDPEIVLNPDCVSRRIHILLLSLQGSQSGLTLPSFFYFLTFVNACAVSSQTFSFHCLPHKPSSGWLVSPALGTLSPTFPKPPQMQAHSSGSPQVFLLQERLPDSSSQLLVSLPPRNCHDS